MQKMYYDCPIEKEKDDEFQRFHFAERLAKVILHKQSSNALAIGIYGKWGEGKTSIMNFVKKSLKKSDKTVIIDFNPWRFTDENQLLSSFFNLLAFKLDSSIKSKKNKIGETLAKYAD